MKSCSIWAGAVENATLQSLSNIGRSLKAYHSFGRERMKRYARLACCVFVTLVLFVGSTARSLAETACTSVGYGGGDTEVCSEGDAA